MKILRAGTYAYNPYKFVSFTVNGIECQLHAPIESRFALEEEQLDIDVGNCKEAREYLECLMKKQ